MTIMIKPLVLKPVAAISIFFAFSLIAIGQEISGTIVGAVRDTNGAAVAGATVTITDAGKKLDVRTVETNSAGEFTVPNLLVSIYTITVEAPNFKKAVQTNVKLDVGQRRSVEILLQAGRIEEVVTVQADTVTVDTSSAQNSTLINGEQVRELSINNRNFIQLITLAPGVSNDEPDFVPTGTTNPDTGAVNIQSISVNGARSSANTYTVDGADITDRGSNLTIQSYPSIDSIGEFQVLRSLFPAESGRSGGGQINVVTRGGTSQFHGGVYEFVRNHILNANEYLLNANPNAGLTLGREGATTLADLSDPTKKLKRKPLHYNDYGWTFGGPVYFLNFGEHAPGDGMFRRYDRTFFFFSQEYRKDKRSPVYNSTVPTGQLKQGIFTVPVCVQATGTTCTQILNASAAMPLTLASIGRPINPIAQQYVNNIYSKLPDPATGSFTLNYPIENQLDFREEILRLDHSINDRVSMFYRYQQDKIPSIDGNAIFSSGSNLPGVSTLSTQSPGKTHTFQLTDAVSSSLIIQGRFTYGWGAIKNKNIGLLALTNSPIVPPLAYPRTVDRVPNVSGNGFSALTGQGQYDNFSWKANWGGDVTWVVGSHSMKYGATYSKYRKNENALAGSNQGAYSTFLVPGATGTVATPTGGNASQQAWANFLQGTNLTFTQASFDYVADLRQQAFEAFGQDEWRARKNLTLSYGVRYSYFGPPYDKNGRLTNFVPELWSAASAPLVTGVGNRVPDATKNYCNGMIINTNGSATFPNCTPTASPWGKYIMEVSKKDFAPRLGVAWDPFGDGKMAIRTGYGIYHEQVLNGMLLSIIGTNPPFQQNCTVSGVSLDNPAAGCTLVAANTASSIRAIDPHWKTPYYQHWSFDVQRQITRKTVVSAGYYGSKGTHLIGGFEMNLVPPGEAIRRGPTGCATGTSTTPTIPCQVAGQAFFITGTTSTGSVVLDQIRPYRGYRSITMVQPRYNSSYHSMQIAAQQRLNGASQVNLSYTYAKNLTDAQNDRSTSPQNTYDMRLEKGRAALDRRHILTVNYIYELPWYSTQKGFVGKTLGGWQISGIATYQTGLPFTPTISSAISGTLFDPAGLGIIPPPLTVGRPNILCNPNSGGAQTAQQWFNNTCIQATPTSGSGFNNTVGNGGRGIIIGPPTTRFDVTLSKNFRWGERYKLQLRAEAFNVLNHTNFRGINTAVWNPTNIPTAFGGTCTTGCSGFGSVTSTRDPRNMQLGAKFYF